MTHKIFFLVFVSHNVRFTNKSASSLLLLGLLLLWRSFICTLRGSLTEFSTNLNQNIFRLWNTLHSDLVPDLTDQPHIIVCFLNCLKCSRNVYFTHLFEFIDSFRWNVSLEYTYLWWNFSIATHFPQYFTVIEIAHLISILETLVNRFIWPKKTNKRITYISSVRKVKLLYYN